MLLGRLVLAHVALARCLRSPACCRAACRAASCMALHVLALGAARGRSPSPSLGRSCRRALLQPDTTTPIFVAPLLPPCRRSPPWASSASLSRSWAACPRRSARLCLTPSSTRCRRTPPSTARVRRACFSTGGRRLGCGMRGVQPVPALQGDPAQYRKGTGSHCLGAPGLRDGRCWCHACLHAPFSSAHSIVDRPSSAGWPGCATPAL